MAPPRYDDARVILGEGDQGTRTSVRATLLQRGIREVVGCSSTPPLTLALDNGIVDLVVYDLNLPGNDFHQTMQLIRRNALGKNPFVVVIATVSDAAVETVKKAINAGVDDLISKPMSIDRLFARMRNFLQNRKPFVVSYDYVGPTRRVERRPDEDPSQLIPVPNTFKGRLVDGMDESALQKMVDKAAAAFYEKQLGACGSEIDRLVARIVSCYDGDGSESEWRGDLNRLLVVSSDLSKRSAGTASESVGNLATMMNALGQRVLRSTPFERVIEVELLSKLAVAIRRALSVDRDAVDIMQEIASTIGSFTQKAQSLH